MRGSLGAGNPGSLPLVFPGLGKGRDGMDEVRKAAKAGSAEKIFDRLTVLVVNHELLLSGAYGPLTPEQKVVLNDMVSRSKEAAVLLRTLLEP